MDINRKISEYETQVRQVADLSDSITSTRPSSVHSTGPSTPHMSASQTLPHAHVHTHAEIADISDSVTLAPLSNNTEANVDPDLLDEDDEDDADNRLSASIASIDIQFQHLEENARVLIEETDRLATFDRLNYTAAYKVRACEYFVQRRLLSCIRS